MVADQPAGVAFDVLAMNLGVALITSAFLSGMFWAAALESSRHRPPSE